MYNMNGIDILCDAAGSDMLNPLYSPPQVPKQPTHPPPQQQLGKRKLSVSDASPSSTHVCHICKRVYERADHLTRHLRSHENARPYQCSRCPKRFNRADLLTRHETTHDRDSTGKGRTFIRRSDRAAEACLHCASSKSKCEDIKPCSRCRFKNLPCEVPSKRTHPPRNSTDGHSTPPSESSSMQPGVDINGDVVQGQAYAGSRMTMMPLNADVTPDLDATAFMSDEFANPVMDMVLDDIVNFNPVHNYFQDMDFSSWDLKFDAITIANVDLNTSPESATTSRSKTAARNASRAHAAFKRSPWLWEPGPKDHVLHHASQDKERIILSENDLANSPAFDKLISTPGTKLKMTTSARDGLLALIVATVQKGGSSRTPSVPSLDLLNYLVQAHFIHDEHQCHSWIHLATFDAAAVIPELLAGILSSGATYISIPAVWQFGYSLHEVLRLALADLFEGSNTFTRDLAALQAFMLSLDIGIWSGFKRKMEIAESFLQPLMTMLRRAGNFSPPQDSATTLIPTLDDPLDVLDLKWRKFVKRESYKRLVLHLFLHDAEASIGFCKNPLVSYTELSFSLPASRDLWRARSAEQWRNIYIAKTNATRERNIPRFSEVMHCTEILDDFEHVVDVELCYTVLLHGYWGQVSAYREAMKFYNGDLSNKRNATHCLWLKTQYQELYRDLNDFSTGCGRGRIFHYG